MCFITVTAATELVNVVYHGNERHGNGICVFHGNERHGNGICVFHGNVPTVITAVIPR